MQRGGARRFRASVLCRCILRPVDTSDVPAGTSLHRLPLHRCPARIAVSAFASISLIPVAGQQGNVGTYRQGASVVFQNERMPAQRTDAYKRRDAKGRPVEILLGKAPAGPRRFRASVLCRCILRPVDTSDAPAGTSLHRLPLHCRPARIATVPAFSSFRTPSSVAHRHRFFSLVFPFRRLSFSVPHGGDHPCRVSHAMGGDPSCRSPSVALFLPEFSPPPFSPHLFIIIFCISFFINKREICR